MNKRLVIILWAIAACLGVAVAAVKLSQNKSTLSATKRTAGQTLFESFPAAQIASISVQGTDGTVNLTKKDSNWVLTERDNYPAKNTYANDLIRTLTDLKITQAKEAGPSFAPRFGMDETSSVATDRGLTVTFKDGSDKELAKVSMGKTIENAASADSPMGAANAVGRYIRNHEDASGFYAVSEMFPSLNTEPARWLVEDFLNPEKIKSITVSLPDKADVAWKLTRETEEAEFKLEGATATEVVNNEATTPLKSLFSFARFEDVMPKEKVAERSAADGKRTATLETFEGFTYTINFLPTKAAPAPPAALSANPSPPSTDNYLFNFTVAAELPKERKKEDGEKPEDAKTKDEAFKTRLETLTKKLSTEKALDGRTFEVTKSLIESLLKDRAAIIAPAAAPTTDASQPQGSVQQFPGGMLATPPADSSATTSPISATTPPISATTPPIEVTTPPVSAPEEETEKPKEK